MDLGPSCEMFVYDYPFFYVFSTVIFCPPILPQYSRALTLFSLTLFPFSGPSLPLSTIFSLDYIYFLYVYFHIF